MAFTGTLPDGEPIHYIFFLVSPSDLKDVHVDILARISKVMNMMRQVAVKALQMTKGFSR